VQAYFGFLIHWFRAAEVDLLDMIGRYLRLRTIESARIAERQDRLERVLTQYESKPPAFNYTATKNFA
jgi:hypothetical protein